MTALLLDNYRCWKTGSSGLDWIITSQFFVVLFFFQIKATRSRPNRNSNSADVNRRVWRVSTEASFWLNITQQSWMNCGDSTMDSGSLVASLERLITSFLCLLVFLMVIFFLVGYGAEKTFRSAAKATFHAQTLNWSKRVWYWKRKPPLLIPVPFSNSFHLFYNIYIFFSLFPVGFLFWGDVTLRRSFISPEAWKIKRIFFLFCFLDYHFPFSKRELLLYFYFISFHFISLVFIYHFFFWPDSGCGEIM